MNQPDVVVIGAGPAGALAAARLARAGRSVVVLEKQRFPRFSIGESLLTLNMDLLAEAGMLEPVMAASFQYKNGAVFHRRGIDAQINFAEKTAAGYDFTFNVQRAQFDKILADEAAKAGAEVRYEVGIDQVDFSGSRPLVTGTDADGKTVSYQPSFVLDASGYGRVLPRLLNLEKPSNFPPRAAFFTHVVDRIEAGTFDRQKIHLFVHPGDKLVWYWLIPFSDGRSSIGAVASPDYSVSGASDPEKDLFHLIDEEPMMRALLSKASLARPVGRLVAYSASVERTYDQHYALLGNAAEFLDPLFSSGITVALFSARLASDLLIRQFDGEAVDWEAGFAQPLASGVGTFREFVKSWYEGDLQDVVFSQRPSPIRRMLCSVLAGYAWDDGNPYCGDRLNARLKALAETCRRQEANADETMAAGHVA